jgi:hypothetical protein
MRPERSIKTPINAKTKMVTRFLSLRGAAAIFQIIPY